MSELGNPPIVCGDCHHVAPPKYLVHQCHPCTNCEGIDGHTCPFNPYRPRVIPDNETVVEWFAREYPADWERIRHEFEEKNP